MEATNENSSFDLRVKGLKAVCLYMKAWITTHEISIIIRGVQIIFISPCTAVLYLNKMSILFFLIFLFSV